MTMVRYTGSYSDSFGDETIAIDNDGKTLRTTIRNVEFSGSAFDDFSPNKDMSTERPSPFVFAPYWTLDKESNSHVKVSQGTLCDYTLEIRMPITVVDKSEAAAEIEVRLELGKPRVNGGVDREVLKLALIHAGERFASTGKHGYFENELLEIQQQLPANTYMKICFGCLYSDYSVAGNGLFGDMMCFRNNKTRYLRSRTKHDHIDLETQRLYERFVQETHLCPEFERRIKGTGYRG